MEDNSFSIYVCALFFFVISFALFFKFFSHFALFLHLFFFTRQNKRYNWRNFERPIKENQLFFFLVKFRQNKSNQEEFQEVVRTKLNVKAFPALYALFYHVFKLPSSFVTKKKKKGFQSSQNLINVKCRKIIEFLGHEETRMY